MASMVYLYNDTMYSRNSVHVYSGHSDIVATFPDKNTYILFYMNMHIVFIEQLTHNISSCWPLTLARNNQFCE